MLFKDILFLGKVQGIFKEDLEFKEITYDSRKVESGDLFVCITGEKIDGHRFIQPALKQGASALVIEEGKEDLVPAAIPALVVADSRIALGVISNLFYKKPLQNMRLIGITGTNGKTTTTHLIRYFLNKLGSDCGLIGTIHNLVGDEVVKADHTTPESLEIFQLLSRMKKAQQSHAVMEVSSHALKQGRVAECNFKGAVFTNLTQDHLDYHKTWQDYLASKKKLFQDLTTEYAVINQDDPYASEFIEVAAKKNLKLVTYGIEKKADLRALEVDFLPQGMRMQVKWQQEIHDAEIPLFGFFNIYNVLAAIATVLSEGYSLTEILEITAGIPAVPGRFEVLNEGQNFLTVVDYAHTPDGLKNVLMTAKAFCQGRLITVFGCGGDRDQGKRPIMGEIAGEFSDYAFITSDNPRSEEPEKIMLDVEVGIKKTECGYEMEVEREKAIAKAVAIAARNDIIVIAGKGHEDYQLIGSKVIDFDDREIARKYLKERMGKNGGF